MNLFKYFFFSYLYFASSILQATFDETLFELGKRAFNDGAYNFAADRFRKLISEEADSVFVAESRYHLGLSYFYLKEYEKSTQTLNAYINDFPLNERTSFAKYYLIKILFEREKYTACVDESLVLISKEKNQDLLGKLRILLADVYFKLGQASLAISQLEMTKGLAREEAIFKLGKYYYDQTNYVLAEENFKACLKIASSEKIKPTVMYFYAKSLYFQNKFSQASTSFSELHANYPQNEYKEEVDFLISYMPVAKTNFKVAIDSLETYLQSPRADYYRYQAIFFLGLSYEKIGQPIIALEKYKLLTDKEENDYKAEALYRTALIYRTLGNVEEMVEVYKTLLNLEVSKPYRQHALEELAFYYLEKSPSQSEIYFNELLKHISDKEELLDYYQRYGVSLAKQGRHQEAIKTLELGLSNQSPTSRKNHFMILIGDSFLQLEQATDAEERFRQVLSQKDLKAELKEKAREGLAYSLYLQKKYKESLSLYQELKNAQQGFIREAGYFFSAQLQSLMKAYEEAIKGFEFFIEEFPQSKKRKTAYYRLGRLHYQQKEYKKSARVFEKLLKLNPQGDLMLKSAYWLGWAEYQNNHLEQAIEYFSLASSTDGMHPYRLEALLICGKIYFRLKNYKKASEAYIAYINENEPLKKQASVPQAYYELGQCLLKLRDAKQCEILYDRLASQFPQAQELIYSAFISLGEYYEEREEFNSAIGAYKKGLLENVSTEKHALLLYKLAKCHRALNQKDREIYFYEKIVELGQSSLLWDAKYLLAGLYLKLARESDSFLLYQDIIKNSARKDLVAQAKSRVNDHRGKKELLRVREETHPEKLEESLKTLETPAAISIAHFKLAEHHRKQGNSSKAIFYYQKVIQTTKGSLARKSQWQLVTYYFEREAYQEAYNHGMTYFYIYADPSVKSEEALYKIGMAAHQVGAINDAKQLFKELKENYPHSPFIEKIP